jgi:tyrosyl-tRNA synthetase
MVEYGLEPQVAMTLPILVGTDGVDRMSKSRGNYVGLAEAPTEQFGKVMSIPDAAVDDYWRLCLTRDPAAGSAMESKLALARAIVERYNGPEVATDAEAHFARVVRRGEAPTEMPTAIVSAGTVHVPDLLREHFGESGSHWRRLIGQGAVRVDGEPLTELDVASDLLDGVTLQAGKRRFLSVTAETAG